MALLTYVVSEPVITVTPESTIVASCDFNDNRDFSWDVITEPILYNFRVESECSTELNCNPDSDQDCNISMFGVDSPGERVVINVVATDVSDVCQQLSDRGFDFLISSIKKFSRPFDRSQREALEAAGFDFTCNTLEEQDLGNAECDEFILTSGEFDFTVTATVTTSGGIFFSYPPDEGGGLFIMYTSPTVTVAPESTLGISSGVAFSYISNAAVTVTSESEMSSGTDLGVLSTAGSSLVSLLDFVAFFGTTTGATLEGLEETLIPVDCDCNPLPSTLELHHNIVRGDNPLQFFLTRNSLDFASPADLVFSRGNVSDIQYDGAWQEINSFSGLGNSGDQESWSVSSEWSCTDQQSAFDLDGAFYWRFSIYIRQNLYDGTYRDTRILVRFSSVGVCLTDVGKDIDFVFDLDTENKTVSVVRGEATISSIVLRDGIGLFKTKEWTEDPNLRIKITKLDLSTVAPRLDISPLFPDQPSPQLVAEDESGVFVEVQ